MPGFTKGRMTWRMVCHSEAPASARGLDQRLVDPDHGVEDRHDHEQRVEMDEAQDHREVGVEQPFLRLVDEAQRQQRGVDHAVAAEQRDPGDHADDVAGPERDRAEQEQRHLPGQRADVEGQEIGDREAEHRGDHPDDQAELERAEIGVPGDLLGEHVDVVLQAEGRDQHVVGFVVEEADDHDQDASARRRTAGRPAPAGPPGDRARGPAPPPGASGRRWRRPVRRRSGQGGGEGLAHRGQLRPRRTRSTCGPCTCPRPSPCSRPRPLPMRS